MAAFPHGPYPRFSLPLSLPAQRFFFPPLFTMSTISAAVAQLIQAELHSIFATQTASVALTIAEGEVQEVGVSVTGVVGHAQLEALLKLSKATDTHLSSKRSGAGQRYYLMADNAK